MFMFKIESFSISFIFIVLTVSAYTEYLKKDYYKKYDRHAKKDYKKYTDKELEKKYLKKQLYDKKNYYLKGYTNKKVLQPGFNDVLKPKKNTASHNNIYTLDEHKKIQHIDPDPCEVLICKKREACFLDPESKTAICVHKKVLRLRRKLYRMGLLTKDYKVNKGYHKQKIEYNLHPKRIISKEDHKSFQSKPYKKKSNHYNKNENNVILVQKDKACGPRDLHEMGRRLLDWFKLIKDNEMSQTDGEIKAKKQFKKKERMKDPCHCAPPIRWEFNALDVDNDESLSTAELADVENNLYESCVTPFFSSCDTNNDLYISNQEWCCCFAEIVPPCLAAQQTTLSIDNKNLADAYVPNCDADGFYEGLQCLPKRGQCWCSDRNGHEIENSRTFGTTTCDSKKYFRG